MKKCEYKVVVLKPNRLFLDWLRSSPNSLKDLDFFKERENACGVILPGGYGVVQDFVSLAMCYDQLLETAINGRLEASSWKNKIKFDDFKTLFNFEVHTKVFSTINIFAEGENNEYIRH